MTQNIYDQRNVPAKLGARATADPIVSVSRKYAGQPEITTLTFAGTATDGVYSAEFQDLDVDNITVSITRTGGVPSTNTDLAVAWVAAANNDADLRRFFIITNAAGVVTIIARENGNPFILTNEVVTGPGTLVAAETQTATPATLPMGIAVVLDAANKKVILPPNVSSTAFQIQGITWDGMSQADSTLIPTLGTTGEFESPFAAGSMVPVAKAGVFYVNPEVDITQGDPVFVRVTATGTEVFGALRNDSDGGDALQIQGQWEWNGTANTPTAVRINLPGGA